MKRCHLKNLEHNQDGGIRDGTYICEVALASSLYLLRSALRQQQHTAGECDTPWRKLLKFGSVRPLLLPQRGFIHLNGIVCSCVSPTSCWNMQVRTRLLDAGLLSQQAISRLFLLFQLAALRPAISGRWDVMQGIYQHGDEV